MKTLVSHLLLLITCLFTFHPTTQESSLGLGNLTIYPNDFKLDLSFVSFGERSEKIQLDAFFDENRVVMKWTDFLVEETQEYLLARSDDGENWLNIAGFRILDEEKGIRNFLLEDANLKTESYEYRLKQVKKNGEITFSNKVRVLVSQPQMVKVYPNPILDNVLIEVPASDGKYKVEISDASGKHILNQDFEGLSSTQKITLDTGRLPKGIYLVSVRSDQLMHSQTVVKQ